MGQRDLLHLLFFGAALTAAILAGFCRPDCVDRLLLQDERGVSAVDMS